MQYIKDYSFKNKRALIRVDFNVPLNSNFQITDDTKMKATIPTIQKVLNKGGAAILMSHLGRPKGGYEERFSLKHLVHYLTNTFNTKVHFAKDCVGPDPQKKSKALKPGEILLLENLRFHPEEKAGDETFAKALATLGEVYINDAFATAHRSHASTSTIAQYFKEKIAGYVMQAELENANRVLKNIERPFTAIIGGAKVSDKIVLIENLLEKVDNLLIGGGMSYTFQKALGGSVGASLLEEDYIKLASQLLEKSAKKGINLFLPADIVVADCFTNEATIAISDGKIVQEGWIGLDIGPETQKKFATIIQNARTILWNGPMGVFEMPNFNKGTKAIAKAVVKATEKGAFSLVGGGQSAAALNSLGFSDKVSYISTGGGALLAYIEGRELPGIAALHVDKHFLPLPCFSSE
ncbi:MAG: phosphoglycerate kinase [Cytophagales bacterium]|nr:phosphoglycerate kinase [Cytophagales bacterium]